MKDNKVIFFDFDGTLVDSIGVLRKCYYKLLKSYDLIGTDEEFESLNGPSIKEISKILKEKYLIDNDLDSIYANYITIIKSEYLEVNECDNASFVLQALFDKNIDMYLVTSNLKEIISPVLDKFSWNDMFKGHIFGDEVIKSKPHPEIYEKAMKEFSKGRDVLIVEDSLHGLASGKSAGGKVFYVNGKEDHADYYSMGLIEIIKLVS